MFGVKSMERIRKRGLIIGMLLGDGCIYMNGTSYRFYIGHSEKQQDYLKDKAKILAHILDREIPKIQHQTIKSNFSGLPTQRYSFAIESRKFKRYRTLFYTNENKRQIKMSMLKWLTPEGIAYWWMDDGSISSKKRNGRHHAWECVLHTCCSKEEAQVCIEYFTKYWNISFNLRKDKQYFSLRCGTREATKFMKLIFDYRLASMHYKFPECFQNL